MPACLTRSLLLQCRLEGRRFDLIDSDSFGASTSTLVGPALDVLRPGGLICLTCTAGGWEVEWVGLRWRQGMEVH